MKIKALLFTFALVTALLATQSCGKCKETGTIDICTTATGATAQYFSIEYRDTDTVNYINSIYNLGNVRVSRSTGPNGPWQTIQEDFTDGKFGPYDFTCPAHETQVSTVYGQWYIIEKDTFKTDTIYIKYAAQTDECHTYWAVLEYYQGYKKLPYSGLEKADIIIYE